MIFNLVRSLRPYKVIQFLVYNNLDWENTTYILSKFSRKLKFQTSLEPDQDSVLCVNISNKQAATIMMKVAENQIEGLENIQNLDFTEQNLASFPTQIIKLKNLTHLNLENRNLFRVPTEIGEFSKLKILNLKQNELNRLPSQIGNLKSLTHLNLGKNKLIELPIQIGELENLTYLNLEHNDLFEFPLQICKLKNLTTLGLNGNIITNLPDKIAELKNLKILDFRESLIDQNQIQTIQKLLPNCEIKYSRTDDSNINYTNLAYKYHKAGQYLYAFKAQEKALAKTNQHSSDWFGLSFYALFVGKPDLAVKAALKTLELSPRSQSVESNLALGYLLTDQYPEAEKIYLKWKNKYFPDNDDLCDKIFLDDINALEKAGVHHLDFDKVRKILAE